jgi:hypothetical protein
MSAQNVHSDGIPLPSSHISLPKVRELTFRHVKAQVKETSKGANIAITTRLFSLLVSLVVSLGWLVREREYLTPEDGIGYWFGIIGGSLMLMLLLYPLRKKIRFMREWGSVTHWFQTHMVLGVLGPVFILYHANFSLGAVNSNVAFFSMLLVMFSGIIGRFIYVKINYTIHGEMVTLQELQKLTGVSRDELEDTAYISRELKDYLEAFEKAELSSAGNFLKGLLRWMTLGRRASWAQFRTMRILRDSLGRQAQDEGWYPQLLQSRLEEDKQLVHAYLDSVQRAAEFRTYQKVFAWWHILHIPLFIMLVITGIVHVIAVHLY